MTTNPNPQNQPDQPAATLGWCILELMGHRRLGGNVSEATIAGAAMLRVDVPLFGVSADSKPVADAFATQYYSGAAIYCITPTTEAVARAVARGNQPEPVQRWELPALPEPERAERNEDDDIAF